MSSPSPSTPALAILDLNAPVERDCRPSGRREGSSTLGAEGMGFKAASESLDGDIHVVSVAGEIDLATRPELERALFALPEDGVVSVIVRSDPRVGRGQVTPPLPDDAGSFIPPLAPAPVSAGGGASGGGARGTTRGRRPGRAADPTSVDKRRRSSRWLP